MANDEKRRADALDDFWDIERLIPSKPQKAISDAKLNVAQRTPTPVVVSPSKPIKGRHEEERLTAPRPAERPDPPSKNDVFAEYDGFSPLIPRVKVTNWKSSYNYNDFFCRIAASLHNKAGSPCEEVHFFSYVPQYSQLNKKQLAWYLWWRDCVRKGSYPKTDVSYILLLSFEIINLGNAIDTQKGLQILLGLWSNFADDYPQLNSTLGEWICDYSLIHRAPISFPDARISADLLSRVSFPEAFYSFDLSDRMLLSKFLLSSCNSYNYRKSKFYKDENRACFDKHIPEAFAYLIEKNDMKNLLSSLPRKTVSRSAYAGALCACKTRKHLEIEYLSACFSMEVRTHIGEIVKYIENALRTHLGIRSKLGVHQLRDAEKAIIDEYFSQLHMLTVSGLRVPEYEKLYDAQSNGFSLESALDIERKSWEITDKLVEAFEEEDIFALPSETLSQIPELPTYTEDSASEKDRFLMTISTHRRFFDAVLQENFVDQLQYCRETRLLPEAIADEINEVAVSIFGDILLEEVGDGYRIIEDYQSIFE